jgi:hypothetical protein
MGLPIPLVYGTARIAGNLIKFVAGTPTAQTQGRSKWTPAVQTGWNYAAAVKLALCEGLIAGIGNVWEDKLGRANFTVLTDEGWGSHLGGTSQNPYQSTAYVEHSALNLPNNVLPNYSWEIKGLEIFGGGIVDALPSDVVSDFLTDPSHGLGFPSSIHRLAERLRGLLRGVRTLRESRRTPRSSRRGSSSMS